MAETVRDAGGASGVALTGVARRFGTRWVLRGVDLSAAPGDILVLTGRNGSGKTTLLRILATLLRPTRGTARLFGYDAATDAASVRGDVGFLGHRSGLYDDLTAAENLEFSVRMRGETVDHAVITSVLERVGLAPAADERVRGFSAGMRRRLALGRIILGQPRLLLLDEPYSSLDAPGVALVNEVVVDAARRGAIVVLSTHDVERSLAVATRRLHLESGVLLEAASVEADAAEAVR